MSLYTVTTDTGVHKEQTEREVIYRIKHASGNASVVVEVELPERDFDVFYIGDSIGQWTWQGASQHQVARGRNHREALVNALYCNHGNATRYLVVGEERDLIQGEDGDRMHKVGRVFAIEHVSGKEEADYVYRGHAGVTPMRVKEVSF